MVPEGNNQGGSREAAEAGPSDARATISAFAGIFGLLVVWSALAVDSDSCAVSDRVRLIGVGVGAVLIGSALAAVIEGTRKQHAGTARMINLSLGVVGWLLLVPWTFGLLLISSCH